MKRFLSGAGLSAIVMSSMAIADVEVYAGLNSVNFKSEVTQTDLFENVDSDADGYELGINYQLFDFVGVEAGYSSFDSIEYDSLSCPEVCIPEPNRVETDLNAWNAGVNARLPLGIFSIRAAALRYFFDGDNTEELFKNDEWVYRLGLDVELGDTIGLGVGYKTGDVLDSGYDARLTLRF